MDLYAARKTLSKRGVFSSKRAVFLAVVGLVLVVGIFLRSGQYFGQPDVEQKAPDTVAAPPLSAATETPAVETGEPVPQAPTQAQEPATAPAEQAAGQAEQSEQGDQSEKAEPSKQAGSSEQADETAEQTKQTKQTEQSEEGVERAGQPDLPGSDMILVSREPVEVLASPSSSAPAMYGFPAGRPFRVIGREGGFAQIQDLRSGARGWINEAALAPAPRPPAASSPSRAKPAGTSPRSGRPSPGSKPKPATRDSQVTAGSEEAAEPNQAQTRRRPGLFGRGGLFGGIFGNNPN